MASTHADTATNEASRDTAQTPAPAQKSKPPTKPKLARMLWNAEMTEAFLELLREAHNEGLLKSDKNAFLRPAMEGIATELKELFPQAPWSARRLTDHYKTLRNKHKLFLWMMDQSGTSYNYETGMVSATDQQWEAYEKENGKPALCLKNQGLPHAELYALVFPGNEPAGLNVAEAGDQAGIARIDLTQSRELVEEESDDDKEDEVVEVVQSSAAPSSLPHLQRKRQLSGTLRALLASVHYEGNYLTRFIKSSGRPS